MGRDFQHMNFKEQNQSLIKEYGAVIGFVRFVWKRQNMHFKSSEDYNLHGSGTALSKRHILTCGHCIFSQRYKKVCDEVIFYPNVQDGLINQLIGYKATKTIYFKHSFVSKSDKPSLQQLCLLALDKDMPYAPNQPFPKIGGILQNQIMSLHISGYITQNPCKISNFQYRKVKRIDFKGSLQKIQGEIIHYNLPTEKGVSGAAIFAKDSKGNYTICGIHTHAGPIIIDSVPRMGLYFTQQVIQQMRIYQKQLSKFADDQANKIQYFQDQSQKHLLFENLLKQFHQKCLLEDSYSEYSESNSQISLFDDIFSQKVSERQQQNTEQMDIKAKPNHQQQQLSLFDHD